jgi:hypothetical protein
MAEYKVTLEQDGVVMMEVDVGEVTPPSDDMGIEVQAALIFCRIAAELDPESVMAAATSLILNEVVSSNE